VPVRTWIRDRTAAARIARRVEALVGTPAEPADRVARLESPRRLAGVGARVGARFGLRLDPGRRAAAAVGGAAIVAVLIAGSWVLLNRPHAVALSAPTAASSSHSAGASADPASAAGSPTVSSSKSASVLVVDVVGKVTTPGVYRLPSGSRVADAVQAAGGALPGTDLSTLNLAALVSDGQQIAVGVPGAPVVVADGGGSGASSSGPVNLNTATAAQLDALPGVGPVLAQHILDWRSAHGSFTSVDQLREVSGIGEAKFADLKPLVTV
jgi:competence protein ComEA